MLTPGHSALLVCLASLMVTTAENGSVPEGETMTNGRPHGSLSQQTSQEEGRASPGGEPLDAVALDEGLDEGGGEIIADGGFYDAINGSNGDFNESWSEPQKKKWLQTMLQRLEAECRRRQHLEAASSSSSSNTSSDLQQEGGGAWCPRVWDQMLCWEPTPPNTTITLPCPHYVPGIIAKLQARASRRCGAEGVWEGGQELGWTNYTLCLGQVLPSDTTVSFNIIGEWLPAIKQMSLVGYSVSLATLVISFIILASLRKLRCPRNLLHLHLFGSFMLRALVVLLKSSLLMDGIALPQNFQLQDGEPYFNDGSETWACKVMISVWQYFILANYSWLLMEGLYLHSLIFMALFTDSSAITLYILLGWGLPLGCVGIWVTLRATLDDAHCWTVNNVQWIFWVCIRAPVAVSNLISFFFFLNVVRVLVLKLRSSISAESMKYRKLGKSTLVLVPLFGVHYFVLWGLSTSVNAYVELVWLFLDQVFASFQGFFVAVLYCLMNGEVRQELRKLYNRWYKGDLLVMTSQSTLVSHTKTYTSRGRTSLHSIHSQAERRDRQTPSPQMPKSSGGDGLGYGPSPSPSPTPTLTPSYGSRQQSKDMGMGQGSSESYEESIELQPRTTLEGTQQQKRVINESSPDDLTTVRPVSDDINTNNSFTESTPVEILIDLHDRNYSLKKDNLKNIQSNHRSNGPVVSQNGQVSEKTKEKHLTFSESTEQLLSAKTSPAKENGSILSGSINRKEDVNKGVICVNVNKNILKSSAPIQVDSRVVRKTKGKEKETML